jgi:hypothetical protein
MNPPQERKGTVEVRPLLFSVEESQRLSSVEQPK